MNRDTINWILKKLNTGGRTWSICQRKIHQNGIGYTLMGDYYIPDLKLPEEKTPHRAVGADAQGVSARTLPRPVQ